jgi:hypothetical protein
MEELANSKIITTFAPLIFKKNLNGKMRVIENATVIGRSYGENNVVVVLNETTGKKVKLVDLKGFGLELGAEGRIEFLKGSVNHLIQFETAMVEELA